MTLLNNKRLSASIMTLVFTTACTANTAVEADVAKTGSLKAESAKNSVSQQYVKPGAAISYSHDLGNRFEANDSVTFQLRLQESYDKGALNVDIASEGDLQLLGGASGHVFDMSGGNAHVMDISFTAISQGRHYINVQAMADAGNGQIMPRVFSIPVQVGAPQALKPNANMKKTDSGENIIVMEAEEEIK